MATTPPRGAIRMSLPIARCTSSTTCAARRLPSAASSISFFFADAAGIRQGDNPPGSLARTGRDMIELEPTMLLPALNTLSALQQGRGGDLFGLPDVPPSTKMKLVE